MSGVTHGRSSVSSAVTNLEIRGCHEIPCSFPSSGEVGIVCVCVVEREGGLSWIALL